MTRTLASWITLAATGALALPAAAQSDSRPPWYRDDVWTLRFEPAVSFSGLSGDLTLPRSTAGPNRSVRLRDFGADEPRLAPMAEINLRHGDWRVSVRGLMFSATEESPTRAGFRVGDTTFGTGDSARSSVDFASLELEGGYTLTKAALGPMDDGRFKFRPRLDLVAGLRLIDLDWSVENLSTSGPVSQADDLFVMPLVGLKGAVDVRESFSIDVQITLGGLPVGGDTSYSFDILVGGTWKPWQNAGVQLGYRALFFGVGTGEDEALYEFTGASQGLYAGFVVEF